MRQLGYFTHRDCHLHDMGSEHPECPQRLSALEDQLLITGLSDWLDRQDAPELPMHLARLAHSDRYLEQLQRADAQAQSQGLVRLDEDTAMNAHSWSAALRAAGAAVAAVDAVMDGRAGNAFCAVRPPGHHAMRDKAMGFCLLNNVAIAALYALKRGAKRVAVIDFDVHHGNGTEEILAEHAEVLMLGFYQHPFYPPGGAQFEGKAHLLNIPVPAYSSGEAVRGLIQEQWWPRLEEHDPDLILISAGFDAHREDDMAQLGLVEADYVWITEHLITQTRAGQASMIVSCLEGGYHLSALARSVAAHIKALTI